MSLMMEISDSVLAALRLPISQRTRRLKTELALMLYAEGSLSLGKACELADLTRLEFGILLGQRDLPRRYTLQDFEEDLTYAVRE